MNGLVVPVLVGWLPAVMGLFLWLPPRRAVLWSFLIAWLFLPIAAIKVAGLPDYNKMSATCLGTLLASLAFDGKRLLSFQPRWIDLPMLIWCLCPMASSLANGLGLHDGFSAAMYQTVAWGLPYLIGRIYFADALSLRELALAVFLGGLIYVPLCLWEIRMSPNLHLWVYGYRQVGFAQAFRFGGWRPMVFLQHGLMVGMWMCMTSLVGLWLWWTRAVRHIGGIPIGALALALTVTAVLCKSMGAVVLLITGLAALAALKLTKVRAGILALALVAPGYVGMRASGLWSGEALLRLSSNVNQERSRSLDTRLDNENLMAAHALERPVFGWGGWGRNRIFDARGRDISITDGFWIIALGTTGLVGLGSFLVSFLLPPAWLLLRYRPRVWLEPGLAPVAALMTVVMLFTIDCLPNAMLNPLFVVMLGGLTACTAPGALGVPMVPARPVRAALQFA